MVRTLIQLTEEENEKLNRLAKRKGWSRAEVVRQALRLFPDNQQTSKRHWGLFQDMPDDLRHSYRDSDR